jgi:ribose 5-phosphate isomerase A
VTSQDHAKEQAGRHAAGFVADDMKVGLGTGSTVEWTIIELAERALDIVCTATSARTHDLATARGLKVVAPDELGRLDVAIDGADEVDRDLNLTKGGGGAHVREKIVAALADRFVVVADESKLVDRLGPFGTPVEMLDFAPGIVAARLRALGASSVSVRERRDERGRTVPVRSDNGNLLADARFGTIDDPGALAAELDAIPGIVGHGIFLAPMVERVVVAGGGVRELLNPR